MKRNKRPLWLTFLAVIAIGAVSGLIVGGMFATYETHNLVESIKANDPHDPADGVPIIWLGITVIGFLIGIVGGLIAAIVLVIKNRKQKQNNVIEDESQSDGNSVA